MVHFPWPPFFRLSFDRRVSSLDLFFLRQEHRRDSRFYRVNMLIVKSVGMLHGASAEYASLSMNVRHIKNTGCINNDFLTEEPKTIH